MQCGFKSAVRSDKHFQRGENPASKNDKDNEVGYQSPGFLCRKIREAFNPQHPEYLENLVNQLASALRSDHPEDLHELFEFDVISILLQFSRDAQYPRLRNWCIVCLVSLSATNQENVKSVFQTPEFCDLVLELLETLPKRDVSQSLQLLGNLLYWRNPQLHSYVVAKFKIERFIDLANTGAGNIVEEVLFCLKALAVFPLQREAAASVLRVVAFITQNPQMEFANSALLVILRLILSDSLDVEEFKRLGLCHFLDKCLDFPLQNIVSTTCKVVNKLYTHFDFSFPEIINKLIRELEVERVESRDREDASVSCIGALTAALEKENAVRKSLVASGFVPRLLNIFTRRNIICKVLIVRLLDTIISKSDQSQFEQIFSSQTPEFSVISCALEIFEIGDEEATKKCVALLNDIVLLSTRFGYVTQIRPLFQNVDQLKLDNPEVAALISAIEDK